MCVYVFSYFDAGVVCEDKSSCCPPLMFLLGNIKKHNNNKHESLLLMYRLFFFLLVLLSDMAVKKAGRALFHSPLVYNARLSDFCANERPKRNPRGEDKVMEY